MEKSHIVFAPVILAGGSGTRFWPRSRRARAKQLLALDGAETMIQQTLARLLSVASAQDVWVLTNELLDTIVAEQLPSLHRRQIISEPVPRNTAPACALAAFLLEGSEPDTVLGIFPSDHVVSDTRRFAQVIAAGVRLAAAGPHIVVLGVPPTRAETGYGYVEEGSECAAIDGIPIRRVARFREKPNKGAAEEFLAAGNFVWNGGIFLWTARTLCSAIREHSPHMAKILETIADAYIRGPGEFARVLAEEYPKCENISIDYAVLEPRSSKGEEHSDIYCLPADFGWNDLGSWASLHDHLSHDEDENVVDGTSEESVNRLMAIDSAGNYVYAPGKMVALLGVCGLVVVDTGDALLITTRERSQDVGQLVKTAQERGWDGLI